MYAFWKLIHVFGWAFWFTGLIGTAAAQVATRRAATGEARSGAWSVVRRLTGLELAGMALAPLSGLALGAVLAGGFGAMFTNPALRFVHWKLLLALIALVANVWAILERQRIAPLVDPGGPELDRRLKRLAAVHGVALLMLPAAIFVVILMRYGG